MYFYKVRALFHFQDILMCISWSLCMQNPTVIAAPPPKVGALYSVRESCTNTCVGECYNYWGIQCPNEDSFGTLHTTCLATNRVCDGVNDCTDGSDEGEDLCTEQICNEIQGIWDDGELGWKCPNEPLCLSKHAVCDGHVNCLVDGADEKPEMCTEEICSSSNRWKCPNEPKCIDRSELCNGKREKESNPQFSKGCMDGSDEEENMCLDYCRDNYCNEDGCGPLWRVLYPAQYYPPKNLSFLACPYLDTTGTVRAKCVLTPFCNIKQEIEIKSDIVKNGSLWQCLPGSTYWIDPKDICTTGDQSDPFSNPSTICESSVDEEEVDKLKERSNCG